MGSALRPRPDTHTNEDGGATHDIATDQTVGASGEVCTAHVHDR